ncbi:MAG: GAF domain-containing protein [Chloroflexi bacterium]|nr:GAF domain-containing protein [Chloroflexota bacterium]
MAQILVVDDEPESVDLLASWLAARDFDVLTAYSGQEALELAATHQPDLIILDVIMPVIDGIETCRRLRRDPRTHELPVLLITAHDPVEGRVAGLSAGANDFITKPVNLQDLARRIDSLLAGPQASAAQGQRLLADVVEAAIPTMPCNLAWLLEVDSNEQVLRSRAAASSRGDWATEQFLQNLEENGEIRFSLEHTEHPLINIVLNGHAEFNVALSDLRSHDHRLYRALTNLDLYYVTLLPLQVGGIPLGILLIGTREPCDVETTRGRQLLTALTSQATSVVNNVRLTRLLAERESVSQREELFRQTLLDVMSDGLLVHDKQGRIRFVNKRLTVITGYNEQQLNTMMLEDLFPTGEKNRVRRLASDAGDIRRTVAFEFRLRRADGSIREVVLTRSGSAVSQANGGEYLLVVTDTSERKAREATLVRQTHHINALSRATQMVSSSFSLDQIILTILEEARRVMRASNSLILLRDEERARISVRAVVGPKRRMLNSISLSWDEAQGVIGRVFQEGQPLVLGNEGGMVETDALAGTMTRSVAAAPLIMHEEVSGVLLVLDEEPDNFDDRDLELLQSLAHSAAVAIENDSLYDEAQRRVRELTLLLEASEAASSAFAIEEVMEKVTHQLLEALNVNYCMIAGWEHDEARLVRLVETGQHSEAAIRLRHHNDEIALAAARSTSPYVLSLEDTTRGSEVAALLTDLGIHTQVSLPVIVDRRVVGVAELYDVAKARSFSDDSLERAREAIRAWRERLPEPDRWHSPPFVNDLASRLSDASGVEWCTIMTYTDDSLTACYEEGRVIWSLDEGQFFPVHEDSVYWAALRDNIPFVIRSDDPSLTKADRALLPDLEEGVMLVAPLMSRGLAVGMVVLFDLDGERQFTMSEMSLAQTIANVTGHALENAHLFSELSHRAAQLEMAYNHLREADRLKDEVIQNVSHELRTPLTLIMGYAELLADQDMGMLSPNQMEAVEIITEKSSQLARLVEDILTVRLIESENLRRAPALLSEVSEIAIRSIESAARRANITIVTRVDSHEALVNINKSRMVQVFENLLSNAIKFSPSGATIAIEIEDGEHTVETRVIDRGMGIPEEEHDRIWWRFYQVDGSTTRQFGGTGLGLAIVKRVVEQHDGHVWVRSRPGEGSTFGFTLPIADNTENVRN